MPDLAAPWCCTLLMNLLPTSPWPTLESINERHFGKVSLGCTFGTVRRRDFGVRR